MSFDSEWSQLKADAAGQQSAHARLNQLAAVGGGGGGEDCAHISNHPDYSKKRHANDYELIAASFRNRDGSAVSVSEISKIVK
jgi:hypothetical protein